MGFYRLNLISVKVLFLPPWAEGVQLLILGGFALLSLLAFPFSTELVESRKEAFQLVGGRVHCRGDGLVS